MLISRSITPDRTNSQLVKHSDLQGAKLLLLSSEACILQQRCGLYRVDLQVNLVVVSAFV